MEPDQVEMFGICLRLGAAHPLTALPGFSGSPQNNSTDGGSHQTPSLTFRDEFERAAEYSEPGLPPLGAVVEELVAQPIATLATGHLAI